MYPPTYLPFFAHENRSFFLIVYLWEPLFWWEGMLRLHRDPIYFFSTVTLKLFIFAFEISMFPKLTRACRGFFFWGGQKWSRSPTSPELRPAKAPSPLNSSCPWPTSQGLSSIIAWGLFLARGLPGEGDGDCIPVAPDLLARAFLLISQRIIPW